MNFTMEHYSSDSILKSGFYFIWFEEENFTIAEYVESKGFYIANKHGFGFIEKIENEKIIKFFCKFNFPSSEEKFCIENS